MAIGADNFSVSGVQQILHAGYSALIKLQATSSQVNLLNAVQRLKQKIIFLEELEQKVIDLFPEPKTREGIRAKFAEYNAANFSNFYGENLRNVFIDKFLAAAKATKGKTNEEQNKLAQYILQQLLMEVDKNITGDELGKMFNDAISTVTITDKGSKVVTTTRNTNMIGFDENKAPYIIVEKLTPAMRDRLQELLGDLNNSNRFPNIESLNLAGFTTNKNSIDIRIQSEWFSFTKGMSKEQIRAEIDKDKTGKYKAIRDKANKDIINLLASKVSSDAQTYLRKFLEVEIKKDPYLFFIGKAATELTGLLGEIAAVIAIKKLTGKTPPIQWVANVMSNGKKVSIDIVLKNMLGIQVKNTSQNFNQTEGFHNVEFVKRSPEDVLNKLLGDSVGEDLGIAYETSYFNKSYQIVHKRPHVIKGSNSNFDHVETGLLDFQDKLKTYLYQFAPELTFMANDELDKQLLILDEQLTNTIAGAGNILYVVGGVPFFPSEMLKDLIQDLEMLEKDLTAGTNFRNSPFFLHVGGSGPDIISTLNDAAEHGTSVKLSEGFSKDMTIQMTSSWLF